MYQNQHTLLVSLLPSLLLVAIGAGQGLVDGGHGDNTAVLQRCMRRACLHKKVRELMPSGLA